MLYPHDYKWIEHELAEMQEAGDLDPENTYFRKEIERRIGWTRYQEYIESERTEWALRFIDEN